MKVLCVGSAVMDIIGYPIGQANLWKEKQRISSIRILPGGDAVNQSIYLASLGVDTGLAACIGADMNGEILKHILESKGVNTGLMKEMPDSATGTAMVLVDEQGERRIFSAKGAHSLISREDIPWELPKQCQAISLASIFSMPYLEKDGLLEYLQYVKKEGKLVFADLAADKLGLGLAGIEKFLPYIDYFLPSKYDILHMAQTESVEEAAEFFLKLGVKHVIIKCGEDGCYCRSAGWRGWIPAIPVQVTDTTGAGDCMVAVFISRILAEESLEAAARYACAAASYSTTCFGASTAQLSDALIRQMLEETK